MDSLYKTLCNLVHNYSHSTSHLWGSPEFCGAPSLRMWNRSSKCDLCVTTLTTCVAQETFDRLTGWSIDQSTNWSIVRLVMDLYRTSWQTRVILKSTPTVRFVENHTFCMQSHLQNLWTSEHYYISMIVFKSIVGLNHGSVFGGRGQFATNKKSNTKNGRM